MADSSLKNLKRSGTLLRLSPDYLARLRAICARNKRGLKGQVEWWIEHEETATAQQVQFGSDPNLPTKEYRAVTTGGLPGSAGKELPETRETKNKKNSRKASG